MSHAHPILEGLSLVDLTGRIILATTVSSLLASVLDHVYLHARYAEPRPHFAHAVLTRIVPEAGEAARRSGERNTQAVIEEGFHLELRPLLLAERFVRAATGLVIILGLLGTFTGSRCRSANSCTSCLRTPVRPRTSRWPSPMA